MIHLSEIGSIFKSKDDFDLSKTTIKSEQRKESPFVKQFVFIITCLHAHYFANLLDEQ